MKNFLKKRLIPMLAILCVCALIVTAMVLHKEAHLDRIQSEMLSELDAREGEYDAQKIVLHDTSKRKAEVLAEKLDAKLRITSDGRFATLTLPDGITIRDIFSDDSNREILEQLAPDYVAKVADIDDVDDTDDAEKYVRPAVMPNYTVSDPYYSLQTYLGYINLGNAWSYGYMGSGRTVAIIDTGIDTDHPEFSGRISEWSYNATEDKIVKDYNNDWSLIEDEQGHGTAVAGVLAAAMDGVGTVGISPDVNIIVIKAECDSDGNFYRTSDLVFGLYYAIERDVDVVNMSFGGGELGNWDVPVRLAEDSDILMVAAAGNKATAELSYPAAHEMVIGVGALEADGWNLAAYSNYGENVNLVAPGTVYTTKIGGEYGTMDGTSFSSPIVAASLVLMKGTMPYAENTAITEILYASCYDLGDLGCDWYFGYGALDVNALLCEERGTVTFNMLTDELENTTQVFIRSHTLQNIPEPERLYAVFDGWYYDIQCTEEYDWYADAFHTDLTLYANWVNEDDGIPYTYVILDDGTVEIRSYTGHRKYITIPDRIEGREVSSIGEGAFAGQRGLRQVNLPKFLKKIRREAFAGCSNLVLMRIPDTVTSIGEKAFYDNVRLSSISFGKDSGLTEVGNFAFGNCGKLRTMELPSKLEHIDGSAFFGTTAMTAIHVARNNRNFVSSEGVLFNKTQSTLVAYPAGITNAYMLPDITRSIGDYAFGYTRLTGIDLKNVTSIGTYAFAYSGLAGIVIPDSVTSMGKGVFSNSMLSGVSIGSGLESIPGYAFEYCRNLEKIEIPENIREIGGNAFFFASLSEVQFSENGNLVSIGVSAFFNCPIEALYFPDSLMVIEMEAFYRCCTLTTVTWGENSALQSIENSAFAKTYSLTTVAFPKNLQSIGSYAFLDSGLEDSIVIPASVTNLDEGAFASCHRLSEIRVEADNKTYVDYDGVVYTRSGDAIVEYPAGKTLAEYTVRDGVTAVGKAAFYGAWNLTYVGLPEGITVLEDYAFFDCENISSYVLPESLENIKTYALSQNFALGSLSIPDNVVQIGGYAFRDDMNLSWISINDTSKMARIGFAAFAYTGVKSFRMPRNISSVAQYAFEGCKNLYSVTFAQDSRLESISAFFFKGCDSIQNITFENGSALTSIQAHGFEGMKNLQSINFGDAKLTNIDNHAFRYCSSLSSLNVPETLTNIGRFAFYKCTSFSSLSVPNALEHIGSYAFHGTNNCNLYFASETLPLYLDENWDDDLGGYYTGVTEMKTAGDWQYAKQTNGKIAIIQYLGSEKHIDLTQLSFGEIETIGGYAFYAKDIESIVMPNTVKQIQRYAFAENRNLYSVVIPASTEYIAQYAFYNTGIESLAFAGNHVKVIEQYAFAYTKSLKGVNLPSSLEKMGSYAFYRSGIEALTFSADSVMSEIPKAAFAGTNLVSVTIPERVTLINHNAFRECHSLKNVTFGSGENLRIMSNAFYDTGLEQVYIPENVEYIGEYAFVGLKGLAAFAVSESNADYAAVDGVLCNKAGTKIIAFPAGRAGSFVVPQNVEVIGFGAFENSALSSVTFEDGINLLAIGYRAFFSAENLTEIAIPSSVVSIDYYAFARCANLTTVMFAEESRLTGIYEGAFFGCNKLQNIVIPDSIIEISDYAFYGCTALKTLPISETNEIKGIYSYAMAYTGLRGELMLPSTLIDIGDYAFRGTALTDVVIPDDNAWDLVIGIGAFADCRELEEITVPFIGASFEDTEITWFGYIFGAGSYQANATYVPEILKKVHIAEGISFAGTGAFYGLEAIEEIDVPASVSLLYYDSFVGTKAKYTLKNEIYIKDKWGSDGFPSYSSFNNAVCSFFGKGISGEVVLAEGLTSIGRYAFRECSSLMSVVIPNSVTSIKEDAFFGCSGLTSIVIPDSVMSIEEYAFCWCDSLYIIYNNSDLDFIIGSEDYGRIAKNAKLIIDKDGNKIYKDGASRIEYVDTIDGFRFVRENDQYTLISYLGEKEIVTLPRDIKGDNYKIYRMNGVRNVIIPDSITSIGDYAFRECSSLTSVVIPDSVMSIGDSAFRGCSSLTSVVIPDSVTSIGNSAFYDCSSLTSIEIPDSVTSIGYDAFSGCSSLTNIEIPDSVTSIGGGAFSRCRSLASITIPDNVIGIESAMFLACSNLTNISLPENLAFIGSQSFSNCDKLANIEIPDSVTSIDDKAFWRCSSLKSITIPDNVVYIGSEVFYNCYFDSIKLSLDANFIYEDGILWTKDYSRTIYVSPNVKSIVIPEGVTNIERGAFKTCTQLTSVVIPDSVTSIGDSAFSNCKCLTSIVIPEGVTSIGDFAFWGVSTTSIVIPSSVTDIGRNAFGATCLYIIYNNSNIPLTFGSDDNGGIAKNAKVIVSADGSVQYREGYGETYIITDDDFLFEIQDGCYTLIAYLGTEDTVTLPENVNGNSYDICGMRGVKNVIIPDGVTSIEESLFAGCSNLTSIVIPDGVTNIERYAFLECSSLTSIVIPESVSYIGIEAFGSCYNLKDITMGKEIIQIGLSAFGTLGYEWAATNYFGNPDNWTDGCLRIGKHFIRAKEDVEFVDLSDVIDVADGAFEGCYKLKKAIIGGDHWGVFNRYYIANLETLVITEAPTYGVNDYFGYNPPITLKTVILKHGVDVQSSGLFSGITGVTIYVEDEKIDCPWDHDYPGWNNGNKVYYGGEWSEATFSSDGQILSSDVYLSSQVVRLPYVGGEKTEDTEKVFIGWDFDGDGKVDSLPVTLIDNVTAEAVFETKEATYHIEFVDKDGKTVLASYALPYGAAVPCPENPVKTGYSFLGWNGYYSGLKATRDMVLSSLWRHDGEGHRYTEMIVPPTCTSDGYTLHFCEICGESYKDHLVPATGHAFGDWITDKEADCLADGLRHRTCACGEVETEIVAALGHDYHAIHHKDATCTEHGEIIYECSRCHDRLQEETEKAGHRYEKKYVSESWLRRLIKFILNIVFGYEGDQCFYYECADCGHIQRQSEAVNQNSSVQSACIHEPGEWETLLGATTEVGTVEACKCTKCGAVIEARISGEPLPYIVGDINGDGIIDTLDLTRLRKYLAEYPVEIGPGSDLNGDGIIDTLDLTRLRKYLAGYSVDLGA